MFLRANLNLNEPSPKVDGSSLDPRGKDFLSRLSQMLFQSLLLSTLSIAACPYSNVEKRDVDHSGTAAAKLEDTWAKLQSTKGSSGSFPFGAAVRLLTTDMHPSVEFESDQMPSGRPKLIHSVGTVAKAVFESAPGSTYTGLFQGSNYMIIRTSVATPPKGNKIAPGVAIKLFRDGLPSANFVAMWALDGQDEFNFFKHDFSNHVPVSNISAVLQVAKKKFESVSQWPGFVGLSDLAKHSENGSRVPSPHFPFQLLLRPKIATANNNDGSGDIYDQLTGIKPNTLLWDVYGNDCPTCRFQLIGSIKTASEMIRSAYGDSQLFFKHQRYEDDLKLRPLWAVECSSEIECDSCIGDDSCVFE